MAFACPCCGNLTLTRSMIGMYEQCPVCYWEDDPQQAQNPDAAMGANQLSLNRARINYRMYGASEERYVRQVRRPRDNEKPRVVEAPVKVVERPEMEEESPERENGHPQRGNGKAGRDLDRPVREHEVEERDLDGPAREPEKPRDHKRHRHETPSHPEHARGKQSIDNSAVREAATRIAPFAIHTPVMTSSQLDSLSGRSLFFKCEIFQRVGAFKFRGACNAVMKLPTAVAKRGVVTHSSGNHAQALALAARIRNIPAHIVMPKNSSAIKVQAVEGYGGRIILCEPSQAARERTAHEIVEETGGTLIPPYNHPDIIAGQGTVALELLEQVAEPGMPGLDAIIAPIGGGGLVSGICIAAHGVNRKIKIIAAEPAGADDAARSMASGQLQAQNSPNTMADGLLTGMGDLTWQIVRDHVERVITVSEDQIAAAMRLVFERMKLVIEPSAAVAVAAALSDDFKAMTSVRRAGVVLSGGNVDLDKLPW